MTELVIDRLTASVTTVPGADDAGDRVNRLLTGLALRRLESALAAAQLPDGEWCVRRLSMPIALDLERPDAALEVQWADALVGALTTAFAGVSATGRNPGVPEADVIGYSGVRDALVDMVVSVALGRFERAWAWQQLGLLTVAKPPVTVSRQAVVDALIRHPEQVVSVLVAAVNTAGIDALHRMLGAAGWHELTRAACSALAVPLPAAPEPDAPRTTGRPVPRAQQPQASDDSTEAAPSEPGIDARAAAAAQLARSVLESSSLIGPFRRARVRVDAPTAQAWAALAVAEVEPTLLRRASAPAVLDRLAQLFHARPPAAEVAERPDPAPLGAQARSSAPHAAPGPLTPAVAPTPPSPPEMITAAATATAATATATATATTMTATATPAQGAAPSSRWSTTDGTKLRADGRPESPTPWAGLIFLLGAAEDADVPGAILDDPALAGRRLASTLFEIGRRLVPARPTDPALFALAGLVPASTRGHDDDVNDDESAAIDAHALRWARAAARRLHRRDDPVGVVAEFARRDGVIIAEPGWIDVRLPLESVDIDVRRAGLDVDPGWLPWLGTVVRFSYE